VRFRPPAVSFYERSLPIVLNNDNTAPISLQLLGAGSRASLVLAHEGRLFLPTTCVGASSTAAIRLTNPSRLPIAFEWDLSARSELSRLGLGLGLRVKVRVRVNPLTLPLNLNPNNPLTLNLNPLNRHAHGHLHGHAHIYIYIHICIYRERERI